MTIDQLIHILTQLIVGLVVTTIGVMAILWLIVRAIKEHFKPPK